jgi:hypothetical protein
VLLGALVFVSVNLAVDLLYRVLDPRLAVARRPPGRFALSGLAGRG